MLSSPVRSSPCLSWTHAHTHTHTHTTHTHTHTPHTHTTHTHTHTRAHTHTHTARTHIHTRARTHRYRTTFVFGGQYKNGAPRFECGDHWLWMNDDGTWASNGGEGDYSIEFVYCAHGVASTLPPVGEWVSSTEDTVRWRLER
jgi:hypothetical protein